ncbi:alpha/beta fold hydrolase [Nonomuraea zeae]|uniref:Alpha/beta hydrolase n=1 Tax=Nonomuraea zeae TaxID=1642303 RepID=A0A5S4F9N6_9ACTN|nr:alpha/beta hydrolase [Nonomuraea zeae]TMR13047.1 alpha/beta hydrolase [Nonomuraea zeae]
MGMTASRVASADGTSISFLSAGTGPGLVVLPGNNRRARHYMELALALSAAHSVHVLDRRGRGESGPQGPGYGIDREVDDVLAVMAHTGADRVFGHSYGGLVALHVALRQPVRSLVVYEPGVSLHGRFDLSFLPEFARRVQSGQRVRPMALFLRRMGLLPFGKAPAFVYIGITALVLAGKEGAEMRRMMPTTAAEIGEVARLDSDGSRYREIRSPTLVLAGDRSLPAFLSSMCEELAGIIPGARYELIAGLGHNAPDNDAPAVVAERITAAMAQS